MRELKDAAIRQEEDKRVLASSFFSSWHFLDIPEMGWCIVVVTDSDQQLADQLSRDLAKLCWNQRKEYIQCIPSYVEALDKAFSTDIKPIVIADFADMVTGGGTGDSTWYLKELMSREPKEPCYLYMVDPQAVKSMAKAGAGTKMTLMLGGKQDNINSTPVEVNGRVLWILPPSEVRILPKRMGLTAVLQAGKLYVVVMEHSGLGTSPMVYSGAGLDPEKAKILIAKSSVSFREPYKGIAKLMLLGEAPGFCPNNLRSIKYVNVPRPIFPLDDPISWDSSKSPIYRGHSIR
jgi:microcystin degradation protein MlrC